MSDLNTNLRYDLMKLCGFWTVEIPDAHRDIVRKKGDNGGFITICWWDDWNPTTDLNQLRECYLAAERDDHRFAFMFGELLLIALQGKPLRGVVKSDIATAWVKHPELVAQAILKAKGVS